ncbi:MAG: Lpg1974 family pore-forming outer membrane protein [Chlamydiota bacterium]
METKWSLNKVLMSSVAALLAATGTFAAEASSDQKSCQEQPGPFAFCYPRDVGLACPNDFYAHGQFLLMRSAEDGLEYAISNTNGTDNFPLDGGTISGYHSNGHSWKWDYGVRAGFGFYMGKDLWNVEAQWTHVKTHENNSTMVRAGCLDAYWLPADVDASAITRSSAQWRVKYDTFDVSFAKPFHASRYFVLQPQVGIRAAWIDQHYLARYAGSIMDHDGTYIQDGAEMKGKNDFWGVGLRSGFTSEYILGSGWSLHTSINGALLYGKFHLDQECPIEGTEGDDLSTEIHHDPYVVVPNMDISLGLGWGHLFDHDKYRFSIKVAYEFHQWWKQMRLRRFFDTGEPVSNETVYGDYSLNGLSFAVQFDF